MEDTRKTEHAYWDDGYAVRDAIEPLAIAPFRNFSDRALWELIVGNIAGCSKVLEIGGGGSALLARLALEFPDVSFTALDYSEAGLDLVSEFAAARSLPNLHILHRDMFAAPDDERFDLVISYGVVEHFSDLAGALRACSLYLGPGGRMLTIIPNMAGAIGSLTRRYNREVYDIHVAHDLASFASGHDDAGLTAISGGYLASNNFGVAAAAFETSRPSGYRTFLWLTRLTRLLDMFENAVCALPVSRLFSPYIYVLSARETGDGLRPDGQGPA